MAGTPSKRPFHVPPGTPLSQRDVPNPWHSVYQNSGLAPSFGARGGAAAPQTMSRANLASLESDLDGRPAYPVDTVHAQGASAPGREVPSTPMSTLSPDTRRATCGSIFEYLTVRSPRNTVHTRFSGSRIGTQGKQENKDVEEVPVTTSTIMYQTTAKEVGKHSLQKKHMTSEEAEEYLRYAAASPIKAAQTHWESDEQRQLVMDSLESENFSHDAAGGSWVLRAGAMPPARAMIKNPDKMFQTSVIGPDRHKLLCNLRWQLYVQGIFTHMDLINFLRQYDSDQSNFIPMKTFLALLKQYELLELTAARITTLEQMFLSVVRPGYMDYENFTYTLMDSTKDVPRPRTDIQGGAEAVARNRTSSIFTGLNSLRPKSQSGRFHNFTDMMNQCERPLVLASGNQNLRGMYQFMSEREGRMLHNYRDRDPLRDTYKPDNLDLEPVDLPGRSLPKRVITPKNLKMAAEVDAVQEALSNTAANAASMSVQTPLRRDTSTPSKARGRNVDFMLLPSTPVPNDENAHAMTPTKTASAAELQSPTNVEDGYFAYYEPQVPSASPTRGKSSPTASSGPRPNKFQANFHDSRKPKRPDVGPVRQATMGSKKAVQLAQLRPPAWDVAWRHQIRPVDMLKKLSHTDPDGLNEPSGWGSNNGCNKDVPGGEAARAELKETLAQNQKMNASKRGTNWTYAHGGNELESVDWSSSTQDQMLKRPRLRTPNKTLSSTLHELREAPWSVAERHQVHLMKYDHRLVGLRRPEPLAKA